MNAAEHPHVMSRLWEILACSLLFGLLSIVPSGFEFGVSNNVFHIPYVLDLAAAPEFAGDALYRSLDNFTSAVWPVLRAFSNERNVATVFLVAYLLSRWAAFAAILMLIRHCGIRMRWPTLLCLGVIAISPWLQGLSVVGGHGLFLSYFTHSETTWPTCILALLCLARGRLGWSAAWAGITFCLNAFVGIWMLFILAGAQLFSGRIPGPAQLLKAALAFIACALPVIVWIALSIKDTSAPFSYIEYIRAYYPLHFLIEANGKLQILRLLLLFAGGLLAAAHLPRPRFWIGVQISCLLLLVIGTALPYLLNQRFVFNLHLLRAAGIQQMLAVLLMTIAAGQLLCAQNRLRQTLGILLVCGLLGAGQRHTVDLVFVVAVLAISPLALKGAAGTAAPRLAALAQAASTLPLFIAWLLAKAALGAPLWAVALLGLAAAVAMHLPGIATGGRRRAFAGGLALFAGTALAATVSAGDRLQRTQGSETLHRQWQAFTAQIRDSNYHGVFLVPPGLQDDSFQLLARRPVWVDFKQGAAVMWAPSFHDQWMTRYAEVAALTNPGAMRDYAAAHGLAYFVLEKPACPQASSTLLRSGIYSLCGLQAGG